MRKRWGLLVALAVAVGLGPYYVLAGGDVAPLDTDYGRIFLPELLQVRLALLDGEMLEWNRSFLSGYPFAPIPNSPGLYLPLLALMAALGTPMGVGLANVLHLAFGAVGAALLARRAGAGTVAAAFAALLYPWSSMTQTLGWTLPMEAMAQTWVPWALLLLLHALDARRPLRIAARAALAGAAYALVAWAGGYIGLLYGLVALAAVVAVASARRPLPANLGRGFLALAVFGAATVGLMLGRLLPIRAWAPLTNRADALSLEEAMLHPLAWSEVPAALAGEGWIVVALAALGTAAALVRGRRVAAGLGLTTLLFVVLSTGLLTPFLWEYVPGFDQIRQPRRAWILVPVLLPPIAAVGLDVFVRALPLPSRLAAGTPVGARARAAVGAGVAALAGAQSLLVHEGIYDAAAQASLPYSLSEVLADNAVLHEVARLRAEEGPYRVHAYEATRMLLKHTHALHATYLGLETMEGILGNIVLMDYDVHYLFASRAAPARMWGMLACRWVTSSVPRDDEGLVLIGKYPDDPDEIFEGSDGPYLYRNELCLPRAYLADDALLCVDTLPDTWTRLNAEPFWDPFRTVLVDAGEDPSPALLARFERGLALRAAGVPRAVHESGLRVGPPARRAPAEGDEVPPRIRPLPPPELGWDRQTIELPPGAAADSTWLVLAETYALYPGWTAEVDGVATPLHRANGAATAIPLPAGARRVELRYRTPALRTGLALSAAFAVLVAALQLAAARAPRAESEAA